MTEKQHIKAVLAAFNADPLRDVAQQLLDEGYDEQGVMDLLKTPKLKIQPDPLKNRLLNLIRDLERNVT